MVNKEDPRYYTIAKKCAEAMLAEELTVEEAKWTIKLVGEMYKRKGDKAVVKQIEIEDLL